MSFKKNKKLESPGAEQETISEQDLELEAMLEAEEVLLAELAAEPEPVVELVAAAPAELEPAPEIAPEPAAAIVAAPTPAPAATKKLSAREQALLARAEKHEALLRKRHPHLTDEKIQRLLKSHFG